MEHVHEWTPHFHWFSLVPFLFMALLLIFAWRTLRRTGKGRRRSWCRAGVHSFGCCGPHRDLGRSWEDEAETNAIQRWSQERRREIESRESHSRSEDQP